MSLGLFYVRYATIAYLQCAVKYLNIWAGKHMYQMPRQDSRPLHTVCITNRPHKTVNICVRLILYRNCSGRLVCSSLSQQRHHGKLSATWRKELYAITAREPLLPPEWGSFASHKELKFYPNRSKWSFGCQPDNMTIWAAFIASAEEEDKLPGANSPITAPGSWSEVKWGKLWLADTFTTTRLQCKRPNLKCKVIYCFLTK